MSKRAYIHTQSLHARQYVDQRIKRHPRVFFRPLEVRFLSASLAFLPCLSARAVALTFASSSPRRAFSPSRDQFPPPPLLKPIPFRRPSRSHFPPPSLLSPVPLRFPLRSQCPPRPLLRRDPSFPRPLRLPSQGHPFQLPLETNPLQLPISRPFAPSSSSRPVPLRRPPLPLSRPIPFRLPSRSHPRAASLSASPSRSTSFGRVLIR